MRLLIEDVLLLCIQADCQGGKLMIAKEIVFCYSDAYLK